VPTYGTRKNCSVSVACRNTIAGRSWALAVARITFGSIPGSSEDTGWNRFLE
jgi:hypothetical protein